MKTWKAIRKSFGFQGRIWEEGQTVNLSDDVTPPHHFVLADGKAVSESKEVNDPMAPKSKEHNTFSAMAKDQAALPKTGFASSLNAEKEDSVKPRHHRTSRKK